MGAIIMCLVIIIMGLGFYIFDRAKAGKKFFGEKD
jgi:predicted nucleic acid-binding Zn ribbon protein